MIALSRVTGGRDNNFNLIRALAALAVLVTHCFVLATGSTDREPLWKALGVTWGVIAVDVFFLTSGFLITGSLSAKKDLWSFFTARLLRIYPALAVAMLLSVAFLGAFISTVSPSSFFFHPKTVLFLFKNMTLFSGVSFQLPGVFSSNPYPLVVNGSLWTLPAEVRLYVILGGIWALSLWVGGRKRNFFSSLVLLTAGLSFSVHMGSHFFFPMKTLFFRLSSMFFIGASFYILRERIPLSWRLFLSFAALIFVSSFRPAYFFISYYLFIPYVVFFLAYVPSGGIRAFNRLGDYSYGIYIYAFPVQQSLAFLFPGISIGAMFLSSFLATVGLAVASWHGVEKRALRFKESAAVLFGDYRVVEKIRTLLRLSARTPS